MSASELQPLDVIWLFHGTAKGERKTRMMVCISPEDGFFLPINTENFHRPCFALSRLPRHEWLVTDSHVECNVLEYDEYPVEESMMRDGIIGYLDLSHIDDIIEGLNNSTGVRSGDRETIFTVLKRFASEYRDA